VTTIWTLAELTPEGPSPSAGELLTSARAIGDEVAAVAFGPGANDAALVLGRFGASLVYACNDNVVTGASRAAAFVLERLVREHRPDLILFPGTYEGRDLAARAQARLGSTLMANATGVLSPDRARTEILGGSLFVEVGLAGPAPALLLLKPHSTEAVEAPVTPEVVEVEAEVPEGLREVRVLERHDQAASGPSLDDAKVIVAGGRGLGGPEGFSMLDDLAAAIGGAAVGASRAAVDAGWVPYAYQIGQTGKTVKPEIYLAVGISGALQHVVGIRGAGRILAVNKDPEAPIMKMADLGLVGDLRNVVPALAEGIRRRTGS
jgi:electron transfer flavoprotein alpha subunit